MYEKIGRVMIIFIQIIKLGPVVRELNVLNHTSRRVALKKKLVTEHA